jgi:hypothetical protein
MYTVENVRAVLGRAFTVLGLMAKFTPNTVDDKIVEVANTLLANDQIVGLVVAFLNSTHKDGTPVSPDKVVGAFMEHFA